MITKNTIETRVAAEQFIQKILDKSSERDPEKAVVVALYGNLGSGKTLFVQGVAQALGIPQVVISPTFVIERVYKIEKEGFTHLIHIDCYRLTGAEELEKLGWNEIINNPKNIIFVEWADRIKDILPKDVKEIKLEYIDEDTRKITFVDFKF